MGLLAHGESGESMIRALIVSFAAILVLGSGSSLPAVEPTRPNVILFLVDDLGWSDVGCFGSSFYETPNIDRLAGQGVRFTDAYAACHVCSPTRASILTGKYPATLNLTDWLPGRRNFPFQRYFSRVAKRVFGVEAQLVGGHCSRGGLIYKLW